MSNQLFKNQVYSGLMEILKDSDYYYESTISKEYNQLRESGEKAIVDYIRMMAPHMLEKAEKEFTDHAKKLVWDEIKK